jgi:hypothetical protein
MLKTPVVAIMVINQAIGSFEHHLLTFNTPLQLLFLNL